MIFKILKIWILVVFVVTGFSGTVYLTVQQNYRQSANDPQIQMAEDASSALSNGTFTTSFDAIKKLDISKSLSPFLIIYDDKGNVISTNATLNGSNPNLPLGVFDNVRSNGEDRLTWEPQSGVRIAAVITPYSSTKLNGFVLVGRNLKEIENRESMLNLQVGAGWLATVFGSLVLITVLEFIFPHKKK